MNIFIATKPLQVMICMILNKKSKENYLYVADHFLNSKEISESAVLKKYFKEVFWFSTRNAAIRAAANERPKFIYIDSDVGLKPLIEFFKFKLKSNKTKIHVYEEGIGTYRADLIHWVKRIIYFFVGAGVYFGGSIFTKKIHVFNSLLYKNNIPSLSKKVIEIEEDFEFWIKYNKNDLIEIFSPGYGLGNVKKMPMAVVYITDWRINEGLIEDFYKSDFFYLKPHPHIKKEIIEKISKKNITIVPSSLPAEIFLIVLLENYEKIKVFHNKSSSVQYIRSERLLLKSIDQY